ncbi:MAG TPA: sigma-70 family RNA polymerase sigma factor [Thermoanaerobaculia bacterium]|nr:sigma-70 family RNA polymerase sigma factor [Thermoanaerobaculia bacterium]
MSRLPRKPSALAAAFEARGRREAFALGDAVSVRDCQHDRKLALELILAFQAGRRGAEELLVEVYTPYIVKCARRFRRFYERDLDDFFQEGRLAVLDACARWDFSRETSSPSSYVFQYVNGYLRRYAITVESCVRVPVHTYDRRTCSPKATKRSEWMREFQKTLSLAPICFLSCELEGRPAPAGRGIASPSEDEEPLEHLLFDEDEERVDDRLATSDLAASMQASALLLSAILGDRERDVLMRRFGSDAPETLDAISKDYGVTRERIRQIENIALEAYRQRARSMRCFPEKFERFEDWVAALAERVRDPARERAEREIRARASTPEPEAA